MSRHNHWWKPHFKTKKALEEKIRAIAKNNLIGSELGEEDTLFMKWVLSHHDQFDDKCGCGLKSILVQRDEFNNRFFAIKRIDESIIDISWRHALTPKSNDRIFFLMALREEVKGQIFAFKKSSDSVCGICGEMISGDAHVDHVVPFRDIVSSFFGDEIHETIDMGPVPSILKDRTLAKRWKEYHEMFAVLQMSHARCNLKKG